MGIHLTGSYDAFNMITERGLERIIRASFLDDVSFQGLPYEQEFEYEIRENQVIRGLFRFGLPSVTFNPYRIPRWSMNEEKELDAIGICFPFFDSTLPKIRFFPERTYKTKHLLNGNFTLIFPIVKNGHLNIVATANGIKEFDTTRTKVWLEFANDDPDPFNGVTSADKIDEYLLEALFTNYFQINPPDIFDNLSKFLEQLDFPKCPLDDADETVGSLPVLDPPTDPLCMDIEIQDAPLPLLLSKVKLSRHSEAMSTVNEPERPNLPNLNRPEFALLLANRFLLQEILPAVLIPALLSQQSEKLKKMIRDEVEADMQIAQDDWDAEVKRRLSQQLPTLYAQFFVFPMSLLQPIPMVFPLPDLEDLLDFTVEESNQPNVHILAVNTSINHGGELPGKLNIRLNINGEKAGLYTFSGHLDIHLEFKIKAGHLVIEPDTKSDINVKSKPAIVAAGIALGFLAGGIEGVLLSGLTMRIADRIADYFASLQVGTEVNQIINDQITDSASFSGILPFPILVHNILLDDLLLQGEFCIDHDWRGNLESQALVVERQSIALEGENSIPFDQGIFELEVENYGSLVFQRINLLTGGERDIALHDFGFLPLYRAENICQADLRDPNIQYMLEDFELFPLGSSPLSSEEFLNDPTNSEPHANVRVFGVRIPQGISENLTYAYATLIIRNNALIGRRIFSYRIYHQVAAGLQIDLEPLANRPKDEYGLSDQFTVCKQSSARGQMIKGSSRPVFAGTTRYDCQFAAKAKATPILLREPIENVQWSVILPNGQEQSILNDGTFATNVAASGDSLVEFTVDPENSRHCCIIGPWGKDGQFELKATVQERYDVIHSAIIPISFAGKREMHTSIEDWFKRIQKLMMEIHRERPQFEEELPDISDLYGGSGYEGPRPTPDWVQSPTHIKDTLIKVNESFFDNLPDDIKNSKKIQIQRQGIVELIQRQVDLNDIDD